RVWLNILPCQGVKSLKPFLLRHTLREFGICANGIQQELISRLRRRPSIAVGRLPMLSPLGAQKSSSDYSSQLNLDCCHQGNSRIELFLSDLRLSPIGRETGYPETELRDRFRARRSSHRLPAAVSGIPSQLHQGCEECRRGRWRGARASTGRRRNT